jgi:LysM repeat protein
MPKGTMWTLSVPDHAWGTEETIANLMRCIGRVHEQFPGSPPVIIGSISARSGGHLPPHKSHRTGRDVDIYLYRLPGTKPWYKPAGPEDLDRARVWALMRVIIVETDVEFILLDRAVQRLLEEYALGLGEDPAWIDGLFHGHGRSWQSVIKHVPGHTAHMHVRFVSPIARERGRFAYDRLVEQGHVNPPARELEHEVVAGDSLSAIATRYNTTVDDIVRLNELRTTLLRIGQKLTIREQRDVRGAREAVIIPARRIPPRRKPEPRPERQLAEIETPSRGEAALAPQLEPRRSPLSAKTRHKNVTPARQKSWRRARSAD